MYNCTVIVNIGNILTVQSSVCVQSCSANRSLLCPVVPPIFFSFYLSPNSSNYALRREMGVHLDKYNIISIC